jgi:hypothetical protein
MPADIDMKVAGDQPAVDPVSTISQADATSDANGIIDTLSTGASIRRSASSASPRAPASC